MLIPVTYSLSTVSFKFHSPTQSSLGHLLSGHAISFVSPSSNSHAVPPCKGSPNFLYIPVNVIPSVHVDPPSQVSFHIHSCLQSSGGHLSSGQGCVLVSPSSNGQYAPLPECSLVTRYVADCIAELSLHIPVQDSSHVQSPSQSSSISVGRKDRGQGSSIICPSV